MCTLGLPKRFPLPQSMKNSSISTWITWMRDESNSLTAAIDKEIARRRDPDDPFNGTASSIFAPLQHEEEAVQRQPDLNMRVDESMNRNPQPGNNSP